VELFGWLAVGYLGIVMGVTAKAVVDVMTDERYRDAREVAIAVGFVVAAFWPATVALVAWRRWAPRSYARALSGLLGTWAGGDG
jgi:Na+/glutamate symporter